MAGLSLAGITVKFDGFRGLFYKHIKIVIKPYRFVRMMPQLGPSHMIVNDDTT
jgi:hypothetical protein